MISLILLISIGIVSGAKYNNELGAFETAKQERAIPWGYNRNVGAHGPAEWAADLGAPMCDGTETNSHQSPINIDTASAEYVANGPLTFSFADSSTINMKVENTGFSIVATVPDWKIFVTGGHLGVSRYYVRNIHMHRISEHTFNGAHNVLEFHFVSQNADSCPWDATVCEDNEGNPYTHPADYDHSLAIFSIHFAEGDNPSTEASTLLNSFINVIKTPGKDFSVEGTSVNSAPIDAAVLKSSSLGHYYHYRGSITVPPCVQTVTWTVFANVQIASGADLQNFLGNFEFEDYRPTQPLHGRVVSTNIAPANNGDDDEENNNNDNGDQISKGKAGAVAAGSALFGMILVGTIVWARQRKYRSIHSDTGSSGKNSREVGGINGDTYQSSA
jgi:carbonic anhydrase